MTTFTISLRTCRPSSNRSLYSLVLRAFAPLTIATCVVAQGLDPASLLKPSPDSWPTYHGDYSGRRHSALTQITPDNVKQLGLAWAFQTGRSDQIKASPIVVDGVLYVTTPDRIWAIDARS